MDRIHTLSKVVICFKPSCPYSIKAVELLKKNFAHSDILIIDMFESKNKQLQDDFLQMYKTYPQIFIDNEHVGGYDQLLLKLQNESAKRGRSV
jgi:glutaredoxin